LAEFCGTAGDAEVDEKAVSQHGGGGNIKMAGGFAGS
jgi:hypothetical protein